MIEQFLQNSPVLIAVAVIAFITQVAAGIALVCVKIWDMVRIRPKQINGGSQPEGCKKDHERGLAYNERILDQQDRIITIEETQANNARYVAGVLKEISVNLKAASENRRLDREAIFSRMDLMEERIKSR